MNSAPNKMNSAATESNDEIKNSALCTALRAITVNSAANIAAMENTQKKTADQPDKVIADCRLPIADLISLMPEASAQELLMQRYAISPLSLPIHEPRSLGTPHA